MATISQIYDKLLLGIPEWELTEEEQKTLARYEKDRELLDDGDCYDYYGDEP